MFDKGDREYPYFDGNTASTVVGHYGDWMVSVAPMLFNDRVLLTHRNGYPIFVSAGYCYDKGGSAALAALAWNPLQDDRPVGYKKVAFEDSERTHNEA